MEEEAERSASRQGMRGLMHRAASGERLSPGTSQQNNIVEMMGTTCGLLEMMFRHSIADRAEMYNSMGSSVILLLLQIIDHCISSETGDEGSVSGNSDLAGAGSCVDHATEIFCHFARITEARVSMANLPGFLNGLLQVVVSRFSDESRANALWVVANLACARENLLLIASHPGLLGVLVNASRPEPAAKPGHVYGASAASTAQRHSRKQAVRALMNLTVSKRVQASLCLNDHGLAEVMVDIMRWGDPNPQTRGFAAAAIVNLANAKDSAQRLISLKEGTFLVELVQAMHDELNNQLTASYCLETFRLLAADGVALEMCSFPEVLQTLADVASNGHAGNNDAVLAASTMKRLATHVSESMIGSEMDSSIPEKFLDSLVRVVMNANCSFLDVLGRIGDALAEYSQHPSNRTLMLRHKGIFDALYKLSTIEGTVRCATASMTIFRSFSEEVSDRHEDTPYEDLSHYLGTDEAIETLANLLCRPDLEGGIMIDALELTAKLAHIAACRRLMCRNERLVVALVTKAVQSTSSTPHNEESVDDVRHTKIRDTIVLLMSVKDEREDGDQSSLSGFRL
mmetsp:Transcript_53593/g.160398  ORF Transcript_53593/g.160398 Transcript_53593/m.160398 type:complete len:571 (-) Transcript_53593:79-1791(-)